MADTSYFRLQFIVFAMVSASFTNIYITQPVLPVLQDEFVADMVLVSFSVSAVILGIAISNLPFGFLADRLPIHPIILTSLSGKDTSGSAAKRGNGLICFCYSARRIGWSVAWWLDTPAIALALCFCICFDSHPHCYIHRVSVAPAHFN